MKWDNSGCGGIRGKKKDKFWVIVKMVAAMVRKGRKGERVLAVVV